MGITSQKQEILVLTSNGTKELIMVEETDEGMMISGVSRHNACLNCGSKPEDLTQLSLNTIYDRDGLGDWLKERNHMTKNGDYVVLCLDCEEEFFLTEEL